MYCIEPTLQGLWDTDERAVSKELLDSIDYLREKTKKKRLFFCQKWQLSWCASVKSAPRWSHPEWGGLEVSKHAIPVSGLTYTT